MDDKKKCLLFIENFVKFKYKMQYKINCGYYFTIFILTETGFLESVYTQGGSLVCLLILFLIKI